jgi:hypothetical protein
MFKENYAGTFYDDQKKDLMEQFFNSNLPLPDAAQALKNLLTMGFIDVTELTAYTTRLITGVAAPVAPKVVQPVAVPVQPVEPSKPTWNGVVLEPTTKLSEIQSTIHTKLSVDVKDLLALLVNLSVESIKDAVELYKNHKKFNVLLDLMQVTISPECYW